MCHISISASKSPAPPVSFPLSKSWFSVLCVCKYLERLRRVDLNDLMMEMTSLVKKPPAV